VTSPFPIPARIAQEFLCWLGNDVETPLPQLIDKEISDIEWDKHAVDVRT